jgi:hypothetical protein
MLQIDVANMAKKKLTQEHKPDMVTKQTCSELHYQGSVFAVEVKIGMPSQPFQLIADTGSNAIIVPTCRCVELGYCKEKADECYDEAKSDTSSMKIIRKGNKEFVNVMQLSYGSGQITVTAGSDLVQVADVLTYMTSGVYLLEDRRNLRVSHSFEGILGLGLPGANFTTKFPLWAEEADVSRYSLCFNDQESPGAIKMNVPPLPKPMTNLGVEHWGLDFQGISVGNESSPVLFCDPSSKQKHMVSACGGVPDSGTTMILGPQTQILELFRGICRN